MGLLDFFGFLVRSVGELIERFGGGGTRLVGLGIGRAFSPLDEGGFGSWAVGPGWDGAGPLALGLGLAIGLALSLVRGENGAGFQPSGQRGLSY